MGTIAQLLANNIRFWREQRNFTQEALSVRLGVTSTTIQSWESTRRWPSSENIDALARALDVGADELFLDRSKIPQPTPQEALAVLARAIESSNDRIKEPNRRESSEESGDKSNEPTVAAFGSVSGERSAREQNPNIAGPSKNHAHTDSSESARLSKENEELRARIRELEEKPARSGDEMLEELLDEAHSAKAVHELSKKAKK